MFLSVLTKNLNWESLTKNLINLTLLWGFTKKSDFFRKGRGQFSELRGKGVW